MNPENQLGNAERQDVRKAIHDLASRGCFTNPVTPAAESKLLDEVREDLPGFAHVSDWMIPVLMEHGWNEEQVGLLVSGIDMALMLVHEVLVEEAGEPPSPDIDR